MRWKVDCKHPPIALPVRSHSPPFRDHGLMFGRCKLQLHAARHHLLGCFLLTVYRSLFFLAAVLEITTAVSHGKLNKNRNLMLTQMGKDCHKLSKTWCIDPLGGSQVFTGRCFWLYTVSRVLPKIFEAPATTTVVWRMGFSPFCKKMAWRPG